MNTNNTTPSAPSSGGPWWTRYRDTVVAFLPKQVQDIIAKGLLRPLLYLIATFVVAPVLIAYLAAFWVTQLGKFDNDYAKALHSEILMTVKEGFSVDEVANEVTARSNRSLDYVQLVEETLSTTGERALSTSVSTQDWQRIVVSIEKIELKTTGTCSLRETGIDAIIVSLEGEKAETLLDTYRGNFKISQAVWQRVVDKAAEVDRPKTLSFQLAEPIRATPTCNIDVHVVGAVLVYKNIDGPPKAA